MEQSNKFSPGSFDNYMEITYKSRKFILSIISIVILTALSVVAIFYPAIVSILPTFVSGLVGILSVYFAGNVANKYVMNKALPNTVVNDMVVASGSTESKPTVVTNPANQIEDKTAEA